MKTPSLIVISLLAVACGDDSSTTNPGDDAHPLDGTCEPIAGASSYDVIDAAFTSGALSLETSLVYKAFAEFQDPRLPAECLGDDTNAIESKVIAEIYDNWDTLSADAQALLEPFLIPPAYVGSWANAMGTSARLLTGASLAPPRSVALSVLCNQPEFHPDWASKPASDSGLVKVWYNTTVAGEATRAQTILTAVENQVWPKLVGTLGMRAPLSDGAEAGCNGGDGRLDIYLTHIASKGSAAPAYGLNMPIDVSWKYRPAFLQINHNLEDEELKATVAHEFMHASQWAYPIKGIKLDYTYPWLKEATAQWAIDYVYPTDVHNFEQLKAPKYIAEPFRSLESGGPKNDDHMYGSYMFFLFLTKTQQPSIIKNIWEQTTLVASELGAVDAVIPGGFKEQWPKFAKALWNRDPVETSSFYSWDAMVYPLPKPKPGGGVQDLLFDDTDVQLGGVANASLLHDSNLKHLAIRYYKWTFPNDVTTRSVAFSAPDPFISVQAFIQKTGSPFHVWEDWSGGNVVKHYCIDLTAERLTELIIVLSNDSMTEDAQLIDLQKPRLLLSSVGCWKYQGTTTTTINDTGYTETVTTNVTLDVDTDPTWANDYFRHWKVNAGTANGTSVSTGSCTITSNGSGAMTTGNAGGFVDISFGYDFGAGSLSGRKVENASGDTEVPTTTTYVCPGSTTTNTNPMLWHWLEQPTQTLSVSANGSVHLDVTEPYNTGTRRLQWDFAPLRQ